MRPVQAEEPPDLVEVGHMARSARPARALDVVDVVIDPWADQRQFNGQDRDAVEKEKAPASTSTPSAAEVPVMLCMGLHGVQLLPISW